MTSDNGWITQEIYLEWFKFFIKSIPPARPALLIEDGHGSHITVDVIELARTNDVHTHPTYCSPWILVYSSRSNLGIPKPAENT